MTIIKGLPSDLRAMTVPYLETWDRAALSTTNLVEADAREAVNSLFRAIALEPPTTFHIYPSPAAALLDFKRWISQVRFRDCMPCYWEYQLPMCHPGSYWRQWGPVRDHVDLAVRRWPNALGCWQFSESLPEQGLVLGQPDHMALWPFFSSLPTIDWVPSVVSDLERLFPEPFDTLAALAQKHDPTCQVPATDFRFLGPFGWLVQEVACADFCQRELGCRINRDFYGALQSVLQTVSLLITFNRMCILCDRPQQISPHSVRYRDGYEVFLGNGASAKLGGHVPDDI